MARDEPSPWSEVALEQILDQVAEAAAGFKYDTDQFVKSMPFRGVEAIPSAGQKKLLLALFGRWPRIAQRVRDRAGPQRIRDRTAWWNLHSSDHDFMGYCRLAQQLFARDLNLSQSDWRSILTNVGSFEFISLGLAHGYMKAMLGRVAKDAAAWPALDPATDVAIRRVAEAVGECASNVPQQRAEAQLMAVIDRAGRDGGMPVISHESSPKEVRAEISDKAQALLASLIAEAEGAAYWQSHTLEHPRIIALWESDHTVQLEFVRLALKTSPDLWRRYTESFPLLGYEAKNPSYRAFILLADQVKRALENQLPFEATDVIALAAWLDHEAVVRYRSVLDRVLLPLVERFGVGKAPSVGNWLENVVQDEAASQSPNPRWIARARKAAGEPECAILVPGEVWADACIAEFEAMDEGSRESWSALLCRAQATSGASPSASWCRTATEAIKRVGEGPFIAAECRWFPLVDLPRAAEWREGRYRVYPTGSLLLCELNQEALKGLCWMAGMMSDPELARALGRLALSCYKKVPGLGPRAVKVGNAAVYALGRMPGRDSLGQLAMLRVKVKFGTAQKMLEKALNAAAAREGLPREEVEELGVPSYGLTEVGRRREDIGEYTAELAVSGIGDTELTFIKRSTDGKPSKPQKSVPAAVKKDHADDLKELKAAAKDIASMLPAQRDRIDSLFLECKSWAYSAWRERYLDHPLIGVLARRLVWSVSDRKGEAPRSAAWLDGPGTLVDASGDPQKFDEASAIVRLWHPIEAGRDEVLAWRRFFEERRIRQPFKQAHREVYLLTDAERRTGTYSNRFAAHILKQHQFNALCAVRGWKNKLRLGVDAEYPPATRPLPSWALRAEFWIEGVGDDMNEASVYSYLTTDQVRFYREGDAQMTAHAGGGGYGHGFRRPTVSEPLRVEDVPPLVLSEVMRDVDLFVGVCSVGNNADWNDGGPAGAYRAYWWGYSFGDLGQTGAGRKELLERLVPRLRIAPRCSFAGNFLVVKGTLRTYKIHLGSGNILMEPDDQYLCIVPSGREAATDGKVFLPFEGDRTLSIILSKAMMLAADEAITDASITRQIRGR